MLRITKLDTQAGPRLVLEGKLTEDTLSELKLAWESAHVNPRSHGLVIDLRGATMIDRAAEQLLVEMKRDGARFVACGVCTRHKLELLGIACE